MGDLLQIFDQTKVSEKTKHILNINEDEYPEKHRIVIRRLKQAIANEELTEQMIEEDELLNSITNYLDLIEAHKKREEKAEKKAEKYKEGQEKALKEVEKEKAEKEKALKEKNTFIKRFIEAGFSANKIAEISGLTKEEIEQIVKEGS